jgi:hypothetical protein
MIPPVYVQINVTVSTAPVGVYFPWRGVTVIDEPVVEPVKLMFVLVVDHWNVPPDG